MSYTAKCNVEKAIKVIKANTQKPRVEVKVKFYSRSSRQNAVCQIIMYADM